MPTNGQQHKNKAKMSPSRQRQIEFLQASPDNPFNDGFYASIMNRMSVAEEALYKSKDYGAAGNERAPAAGGRVVGGTTSPYNFHAVSENISANHTPERKRPYQTDEPQKVFTPPSNAWRSPQKGLSGANSTSIALYTKIMNEIKAECAQNTYDPSLTDF